MHAVTGAACFADVEVSFIGQYDMVRPRRGRSENELGLVAGSQRYKNDGKRG